MPLVPDQQVSQDFERVFQIVKILAAADVKHAQDLVDGLLLHIGHIQDAVAAPHVSGIVLFEGFHIVQGFQEQVAQGLAARPRRAFLGQVAPGEGPFDQGHAPQVQVVPQVAESVTRLAHQPAAFKKPGVFQLHRQRLDKPLQGGDDRIGEGGFFQAVKLDHPGAALADHERQGNRRLDLRAQRHNTVKITARQVFQRHGQAIFPGFIDDAAAALGILALVGFLPGLIDHLGH